MYSPARLSACLYYCIYSSPLSFFSFPLSRASTHTCRCWKQQMLSRCNTWTSLALIAQVSVCQCAIGIGLPLSNAWKWPLHTGSRSSFSGSHGPRRSILHPASDCRPAKAAPSAAGEFIMAIRRLQGNSDHDEENTTAHLALRVSTGWRLNALLEKLCALLIPPCAPQPTSSHRVSFPLCGLGPRCPWGHYACCCLQLMPCTFWLTLSKYGCRVLRLL